MKLEDQVVSLELAKKLEELDVKQESLFRWVDHSELGMGEIVSFNEADNPICSAYTVAELGELINNDGRNNIDDCVMQGLGASNGYMMWLADINHDDYPTIDSWVVEFLEPTEADARAKMLIYLIESKLIELAHPL